MDRIPTLQELTGTLLPRSSPPLLTGTLLPRSTYESISENIVNILNQITLRNPEYLNESSIVVSDDDIKYINNNLKDISNFFINFLESFNRSEFDDIFISISNIKMYEKIYYFSDIIYDNLNLQLFKNNNIDVNNFFNKLFFFCNIMCDHSFDKKIKKNIVMVLFDRLELYDKFEPLNREKYELINNKLNNKHPEYLLNDIKYNSIRYSAMKIIYEYSMKPKYDGKDILLIYNFFYFQNMLNHKFGKVDIFDDDDDHVNIYYKFIIYSFIKNFYEYNFNDFCNDVENYFKIENVKIDPNVTSELLNNLISNLIKIKFEFNNKNNEVKNNIKHILKLNLLNKKDVELNGLASIIFKELKNIDSDIEHFFNEPLKIHSIKIYNNDEIDKETDIAKLENIIEELENIKNIIFHDFSNDFFKNYYNNYYITSKITRVSNVINSLKTELLLLEDEEKTKSIQNKKKSKSKSKKENLKKEKVRIEKEIEEIEKIDKDIEIIERQKEIKERKINEIISYSFNNYDIENIKNMFSKYGYSQRTIVYVRQIFIFYCFFKYFLLIISEITFILNKEGILYIDGGLAVVLNTNRNEYKTNDIDLKYIPIDENLNIAKQIETITSNLKTEYISHILNNECENGNIFRKMSEIEKVWRASPESESKDNDFRLIVDDVINTIKNAKKIYIDVDEKSYERGIIKYTIKYEYEIIIKNKKIYPQTHPVSIIDISLYDKNKKSYKLHKDINTDIFYTQETIPTINFMINYVNKNYIQTKLTKLLEEKIDNNKYIDEVPGIPIGQTIQFIQNKAINQLNAFNTVLDGKKRRKSFRKLKKSIKRKSFRKLKKSIKRKSIKRKSIKKRSFRKLKKSIKRKSIKRKLKS